MRPLILVLLLGIYSVASAQIFEPQRSYNETRDSAIIDSRSNFFYNYAFCDMSAASWAQAKADCAFRISFGATPFPASITKFFESTMPQFQKELVQCYRRRFGATLDAIVARRALAEGGDLFYQILGFVPKDFKPSPRIPQSKKDLSCNVAEMQYIINLISTLMYHSGYPRDGWCEKF